LGADACPMSAIRALSPEFGTVADTPLYQTLGEVSPCTAVPGQILLRLGIACDSFLSLGNVG